MPKKQKGHPGTVVLFVRHGLTPTTGKELPEQGPGPGLTEQGTWQAEQAGLYIAQLRPSLPPLAALVSSPLTRTMQTARAVADAVGLEVLPEPALVDCDTGEWAGSKLTDLAKKPEWSTVQHYPSTFAFPGGETMSGMQARMASVAHRLVRDYAGKSVIAVSHSDPIKSVLADALGMHLDMFQRITVSPASVSIISYGPAGPSVLVCNWVTPAQPPPAGGPGATPTAEGKS
ncbi:MAG TPA: histidine phosphatase family protein [Acidimicrobiales bacterium]|nr:histidine phosphatase family protein [Acidimicrobiales bacterium]